MAAGPNGDDAEVLLQGEPMKEFGSDLGPWRGNVLDLCVNPGPGGSRVAALMSG